MYCLKKYLKSYSCECNFWNKYIIVLTWVYMCVCVLMRICMLCLCILIFVFTYKHICFCFLLKEYEGKKMVLMMTCVLTANDLVIYHSYTLYGIHTLLLFNTALQKYLIYTTKNVLFKSKIHLKCIGKFYAFLLSP